MSKIDVVRKAMMDALKAGDKPRKEALSLLLSALKAKTIDKREDLTEDEANAVIKKELKQTTFFHFFYNISITNICYC